ncbi:glycine zipper 2TM domain-containing protein [Natronolimnobius sp. AArcel1]|uniref:glycine zipper 2TM domain-containing protein n=1 Tax=Natronolimnobius sp. AArcel1 TaxID=1679093 RepID=UPI0013EC3B83|nr:glycine zipper 2TM domain-containing protein [Natronolimnobius sp. AArcel1]NGM70939.1 glycine zipper 2TM domain-containing protein [Natronolimnobius sp. AArcel1]
MSSKLTTIVRRARYAAFGAAIGAAIGSLFGRSGASTGGAIGGLVGAVAADTRETADEYIHEARGRVDDAKTE